MPKSKQKPAPIPAFASLEEASDWWDEHHVGDYWEQAKEVHFNVQIDKTSRYIQLDPQSAKQVFDMAKTLGTSMDALVNTWVKEKLAAT